MDPVKGSITDPLSMVQYIYAVDCPLVYIDVVGEKAKFVNPKDKPTSFENIASSLKQSALKTTLQKLSEVTVPKTSETSSRKKTVTPQSNTSVASNVKAKATEQASGKQLVQIQNAIKTVATHPPKVQTSHHKDILSENITKYQEKVQCQSSYGPVQSYMIQMTDSAFVALVELPDDVINGLSATANKWWNNIGTSFNNGDWGGIAYSTANYVTLGTIDGFVQRYDEYSQDPSLYKAANTVLFGIPDVFGRALNPKAYDIEPNSVEHWKSIFGALATEGALISAVNVHNVDPYSTAGLQQTAGIHAVEDQIILNEIAKSNLDGLATPPDTAYFWSGLGESGASLAGEIARARGGRTLEMQLEQAGIHMPIYDGTAPTVQAWKNASRAFAQQANGKVTAILGPNLNPESIWLTVELKALKNNPNITQITVLDPVTLVETIIFKR